MFRAGAVGVSCYCVRICVFGRDVVLKKYAVTKILLRNCIADMVYHVILVFSFQFSMDV